MIKIRIKNTNAIGIARTFAAFARRLHGDERGTISILSVFCILMFTMILVMVVNVGRHLDDKLRMQNAADASAYSGGVVLARGMNAIAFSNHLLADIFAITAFLREGRDRNAEQLTPEILDAEVFTQAEFEKFQQLGIAIIDEVPRQREAVNAFGDMTEAASDFALPVFEFILSEHLIPRFQRTTLRTIPVLAQQATREVALRHGMRGGLRAEDIDNPRLRAGSERGPQVGVLWRATVQPVGYPDEEHPLTRTLPIVDADPTATDYYNLENPQRYLNTAVEQRRRLAKRYLDMWNFDKLNLFFTEARLSNYGPLWRMATCAQLERLLTFEYPFTNLPMVLRESDSAFGGNGLGGESTATISRERLEREFQFVSIVYRAHLPEFAPGLFQNPLNAESDALAFAQVSLFIPRPRRYLTILGQGGTVQPASIGGTFGIDIQTQLPPQPADPDQSHNPEDERWPSENWPTRWDLLNQNWTVQLVPATVGTLPQLLQTPPPSEEQPFRLPNLQGLTNRDLKRINTH
jgi:hypothetical protein